MPSLFAKLARSAGATCDRVYSEWFTVTPRKAPAGGDENARRTADPGRAPFRLFGTFVEDGSLMHAMGRAKPDDGTLKIAAGTPTIDVAAAGLPALRAGDLLFREDTGERFKFEAAHPRDFGRRLLTLTRIK